jgi:hypothetical protein
MHFFTFFVGLFSWPVMQYKVSPTNSVWSLMDGTPTKLWKTNPNGSPKLLIRISSLVPYRIIWGHDALRSMEREMLLVLDCPNTCKGLNKS